MIVRHGYTVSKYSGLGFGFAKGHYFGGGEKDRVFTVDWEVLMAAERLGLVVGVELARKYVVAKSAGLKGRGKLRVES